MMSSKLLKVGAQEGKFYKWTEPFFVWLNSAYKNSLSKFMSKRWMAVLFLAISLVFIVLLWVDIPSEMAPLEDRSMINVSSTAQEGATYDYMVKYSDEVQALIDKEIKETDMVLQMVGMGGRNKSNFQISLIDPQKRERTQQEIADELSPQVAKLTGARSFVTQQQTFGGRRGGMPVQYVIQAKNLDSLKVAIPKFMSAVAQSEVFANSDVNLRFTKPELRINIDRDKASLMGVSIQNIAQTLQLSMSEQRIGYFIRNGKQYQIMSQIDQSMRNKPVDLANIYVRNDVGELIQLDNLFPKAILSVRVLRRWIKLQKQNLIRIIFPQPFRVSQKILWKAHQACYLHLCLLLYLYTWFWQHNLKVSGIRLLSCSQFLLR
ncbi:MAG: Multidrug resistance protein MdtC [Bacteroidetes bacterium]|nr:Multidrug resistance protein MdtC [Bacteroidota bacterium]